MPDLLAPDGPITAIWDDSMSGTYPPPVSYAQEFELQWKLALDGDPEYYDGHGVSLEQDRINDRVYEWTGTFLENYSSGDTSPDVRVLDRPLDLGLFMDKDCIDVGCGIGRWTKVMMALGARSVLSVDISDSAIRSVSRFNPNVLRADIMTIPEQHPKLVEQFDFANFWGVGMLTHDPRQAFLSAASTVKPGGSLFLMVYNEHGMATQPAGIRQRRSFHTRASVAEKLTYVDHVYDRRWEGGAALRENVRNQLRNLVGRPKGNKIGMLDMLEPYYTWAIPLPVIEGWVEAAGFSGMEVVNQSVVSLGATQVLCRK